MIRTVATRLTSRQLTPNCYESALFSNRHRLVGARPYGHLLESNTYPTYLVEVRSSIQGYRYHTKLQVFKIFQAPLTDAEIYGSLSRQL